MPHSPIWAWDDDNKAWVKVKVNANGVLEVSMAVTNLDDLADVYVPSPTDGYILYWDEAATKWKCEAAPGQTAAQVAAAIAVHAALTATHGVAGTIAGLADIVTHTAIKDAHFSNVIGIEFPIDGGGSAITTGLKMGISIPFACTITQSTLLGVLPASTNGSIVLDVWKDTYANHPPTVADSICASAKPTIATAQKAQDSTLTGWTKTIAAGDILFVNVDSITTFTAVTLVLTATKT